MQITQLYKAFCKKSVAKEGWFGFIILLFMNDVNPILWE